MNYFGSNFKRLRNDKGLTQEQMAEKLSTDRTIISKWENGKGEPDLDTLISISEYFNVSLDDLTKHEYKMKTLLDEVKTTQEEFAKIIAKLEKLDGVSNKSIDELTNETAQRYMDEGQRFAKEGKYREAVEYYEKAGALDEPNGYYYAMLTYAKLRDHYLEIGEVEEAIWCNEQMEICEVRMMG